MPMPSARRVAVVATVLHSIAHKPVFVIKPYTDSVSILAGALYTGYQLCTL